MSGSDSGRQGVLEGGLRWVVERPMISVLVAFGVAVRAAHLLADRSVHIDEARLALNIAHRGYAQLLQPLDFEQSAPIAFLWAERATADLLGVSSLTLRLLPFALGVGLLAVVVRLGRRLLDSQASALVVALAAVSPVLVHYSTEIKPYIGDALIGVTLTVLAVDLARSLSARSWWRYVAGCTVGVVVSAPGILIVLGVSGGLVAAVYSRSRDITWRVAMMVPVWTGVFAVMYMASYRQVAVMPYMRHFWEPAFLTAAAGPVVPRAWWMLSEVVWGSLMGGFVHGLQDRYELWVVSITTAVAGAVALVGAREIFAKHGAILFVLLGPSIVTVLAASAGRYPVSIRLVLYLVPVLLMLVAAGVQALARRTNRSREYIIFAVLSAALLVRPAIRTSVRGWWSYHRQELANLVERISVTDATTPVYVFANAAPAWLFYTTDWASPDTLRLQWYAKQIQVGGAAFENAPPRGHRVAGEGEALQRRYRCRTEMLGVPTGEQWRVIVGAAQRHPDKGWELNEANRLQALADNDVWLVFSHYRGSENVLLEELEARGARQVVAEHRIGAALFRYEWPRRLPVKAEGEPSGARAPAVARVRGDC